MATFVGKCSEKHSYWGSDHQEILFPQSGHFLMRFGCRVFTVLRLFGPVWTPPAADGALFLC